MYTFAGLGTSLCLPSSFGDELLQSKAHLATEVLPRWSSMRFTFCPLLYPLPLHWHFPAKQEHFKIFPIRKPWQQKNTC